MSPLSLDELIARYLAAVEAGEQPERERLIADHPQFAEALREFFADLDQMDRVIHPNTEDNVDRVPLTENLRRLLSTQNQEHLSRLRVGQQQKPSERIGNYKLLQRIGTGGMGEVWMAEQERPVRRRVALKLIKAGMDSRQVVARFEAERQALAMMDHQNIAKVLDAGTTDDGRPYFVMELVQGIPITQYCDQNKLSIDDRLSLFIPVCKAVQHAHQKGIIHRDLKPSNILVTLYDGRAVPKVIDFGLAKALQHQSKLTDKTLFTEFGQVVGTLQYMSPEQAEMNALDIDTRTDVYALGVLLYELLTGSTPIDRATLEKAAIYKVLEAIREQDPPRPSVRLSSSGEAITGISQQRRIEPRKLSQILQGDLDWIVMKALEKDRTRRYETANGFAEDVQRFIDGDAIEARPPSTAYRIQKFVRKNRSLVSSVATIGVLLILATVVSAVFADIANRASRKAKASEQAAIAAKVKADEARKKTLEVAERARKAEAAAEKEAEQAIASKEETEATLARSNFFLARSLWNENRAGEAVERLLEIPERYRNWEWYYSFREFEGSDMTLYGHEEGVTCVAFSPDGLRIASGSLDGSIKIWDSSTGNEILTLPAHGRAICFAFSPDGSQIVSGSTEKTIRLWDAATGENIATVLGHQDAVEDLAFSPDGTCLASGSRDGTIKLWNPRDLKELLTLDGHNDGVRSLSFSSDSSRLVSLSSNSIKLWNAITGLPHFEKGLHFSCAKFSPDGSYIAVDSPNGIALWNAKSGNELRTLVTSVGAVDYLAFSPEGSRIAGIVDSVVKVWDLATGDEIYSLRGHGIDNLNDSSVNMIAFSPDGSRIASAGTDATVKVWDVGRGKNLTLECDPDLISVFHHEYTSDLARRVAGSDNGEIALWDSVSGAKLNAIVAHEGPVDEVAISPDGKRIVSVSVADNSVKIWDAQLPKECINLHRIKLSKNVPLLDWIRFSEDSNLFATNMGDEWVTIWNSRTGQECIRIKAGYIPLFRFSHDGTRLATVSLGTGVRVWDTATGKQCARANVVTDVIAVNDLAFNPDSSRIAILTRSDVRIFDSHNKFCLCSQVLLARLQITSTNQNVRDVKSGRQTLEKLWSKSTNKSLRIAADLAKANYLDDQPIKSQQLVAFVKEKALKADYEKFALEMQQLANRPQKFEEARQFTDAATMRTITASVVSVNGNRVVLKRADSREEVQLQLNQLIDGDQQWLVEQHVQDRDITRVKDGKKIRAKVMGLHGNKVALLWKEPKTNQPKKVVVELSQLSPDDQAWIGRNFGRK